MRNRVLTVTVLSIVCAAPALARQTPAAPQTPPPSISASGGLKNLYMNARGWLLKAAENMPEEHYAFKPTSEVRSFGELIGHVANTQYTFCAAARKIASPNTKNIEKEVTGKAALVAALKEAFTFCDPAYETGDAGLTEEVKFGPRPVAAGYPLIFNVAHDFEHYGNVVTYMRLKGLVPPSSGG